MKNQVIREAQMQVVNQYLQSQGRANLSNETLEPIVDRLMGKLNLLALLHVGLTYGIALGIGFAVALLFKLPVLPTIVTTFLLRSLFMLNDYIKGLKYKSEIELTQESLDEAVAKSKPNDDFLAWAKQDKRV